MAAGRQLRTVQRKFESVLLRYGPCHVCNTRGDNLAVKLHTHVQRRSRETGSGDPTSRDASILQTIEA